MRTPRRVVSLSPNVSMMLFALGADDVVVGRTQECPAAIQQYLTAWHIAAPTVTQRLQYWQALPVVGTWPLADPKMVKTLRPEAILTSGSGSFSVHGAEAFDVAADAICHFDTRTLHDLQEHLQQLGLWLDKTAAAAHLIEQLTRRCDEVRAKRRSWPVPPTALLEYCVCVRYDTDPDRRVADPAHTILVGGHLAPDLIQLSGGTPVCTQPGDSARWVAFEELRAAQPDVILQYDCHGCPMAQKHPIPARPGWSELHAVRRQAVYPLHANISDPNLCFPMALEQLVDVLNQWTAQGP
jgi:ABC-type Fe3+-hydroxamate transport system substrate-binding protein